MFKNTTVDAVNSKKRQEEEYPSNAVEKEVTPSKAGKRLKRGTDLE